MQIVAHVEDRGRTSGVQPVCVSYRSVPLLKFEAVESDKSPLIEAARELFREYGCELAHEVCLEDFDYEVKALPGKYGPPDGCLLLITYRDQPAACGAFRKAEDGACELKRIYVLPDLRGMGFGRMLTEELLRRAMDQGYRIAKLDTLATMHAAQELYRSLAFTETHRVTVDSGPCLVYMQRRL
jgi:putative acetyltransferase